MTFAVKKNLISACRMKRAEEWDWPPPRHRRYYRTIDYQPSGWSSPSAKRAIRIYWRVTITLIKALISVPLSIIAIGSIWFLWIIVTRFNY